MSSQTIEGVFASLLEPVIRKVIREELRSNGHSTSGASTKASATPVVKPNGKTKAKGKVKAVAEAVAKGKFGAKSEFIRSMPDAPAAEVVAAAAKKGIKLTANHVYNVRSSEKKSGAAPAKVAKAAKASKPAKAPKAAKAAKAAPKAKPAKAAAKKAAVKEGKGSSKISEGRRAVARGDRPKLLDAMAIVMGKETMDASGIIEGLKKKGWLPEASNLPAYISYMLSNNMDTVFERPARGKYKVLHPEKYSGKGERVASEEPSAATEERAAKPAAKSKKAAAAKPAVESSEATASTPASDPPNTEEAAPEPKSEPAPVLMAPPLSNGVTDAELADLGIGSSSVGDNPFESSPALS